MYKENFTMQILLLEPTSFPHVALISSQQISIDISIYQYIFDNRFPT